MSQPKRHQAGHYFMKPFPNSVQPRWTARGRRAASCGTALPPFAAAHRRWSSSSSWSSPHGTAAYRRHPTGTGAAPAPAGRAATGPAGTSPLHGRFHAKPLAWVTSTAVGEIRPRPRPGHGQRRCARGEQADHFRQPAAGSRQHVPVSGCPRSREGSGHRRSIAVFAPRTITCVVGSTPCRRSYRLLAWVGGFFAVGPGRAYDGCRRHGED